MVNKLDFYNKVRAVPAEAKKEIAAGRLKGKTDINPMWRIKVLTEQFGQCGIGWYTKIIRTWLDNASDETVANVEIELYYKQGEEWSKPIVGIGGSMLCAKESKGLYVSDECYKMAYTDAISVACKALGIGADVYWDKDSTKYAKKQETSEQMFEELGSPSDRIRQVEALLGSGQTIEGINQALDKMKKGANITNISDDVFQKLLAKLGKTDEPI